MAVRLAPVLHELAGHISGRPLSDARTDPMQWAYALRDVVGLARPDVLVSHWDPELEADALAAALADGDSDGDWVDRLLAAAPLADTTPAAQAVELVGTLAGLFPGGPPVAASVTGPASVAAILAPDLIGAAADVDDRVELADLCADALAALIGAHGAAGASLVVVVEREAGFLEPSDLAEAQAPLVRALAHQRIDGILAGAAGADLPSAGYSARAIAFDGDGPVPDVALVSPDVWELPPDRFSERWSQIVGAADGDALLLSDGPLRTGTPLENLQTARAAAPAA
jgi:hypothetical protein